MHRVYDSSLFERNQRYSLDCKIVRTLQMEQLEKVNKLGKTIHIHSFKILSGIVSLV